MPRSKGLALIAALALSAGAAIAAPERVVSMNLCTDQMALLLAGEGQLLSVSHVARDPLTSAMAEAAMAVPTNSGRAEDIYRYAPDLVLAGPYSDPIALALLGDLGIEIATLPLVNSLDQIPEVLREAGRLLGREDQADAEARRVEARLADIQAPDSRPLAAFFFANGYSLGAGTLSHDILTRAGFRNLAEELGRSGGGRLSLEDLILNRPDVIITSGAYEGASEAEAIMGHPVLADIPRISSDASWVCGTPQALDALERMTDIAQSLRR